MIELRQWTTFDACSTVRGFDRTEHTEGEITAAWQHLVDTGVWSLPGWYGRKCREMIACGKCAMPE